MRKERLFVTFYLGRMPIPGWYDPATYQNRILSSAILVLLGVIGIRTNVYIGNQMLSNPGDTFTGVFYVACAYLASVTTIVGVFCVVGFAFDLLLYRRRGKIQKG